MITYCRNCGIHRLSVRDTSGVCVHCDALSALEAKARPKQYAPSRARVHRGGYDPLPVIDGVKYCRCRRGPVKSSGYCNECQRKRQAAYTVRRREARTA